MSKELVKPVKGKISESIFDGKSIVIPMADVQHFEKHFHKVDLMCGDKAGDLSGIAIVTKHTRWDMEADCWANNIWLGKEEAEKFMRAWCCYRYEAENLEENGAQMP
jgi:hypothetical protein